MKKNTCRSLLVASTLALSLQQAVAVADDFIENMPQLTQDPDRPGAMVWVKPGVDRAAYTKVMIEPITIYISPDSKDKGLSADELKAVADGFVEALTNTLEPEIPVVNQAGPGVLYIRPALVDVMVTKKKRGLLGYTPIGFVVTAAADAAGKRISLKNAVLEIESLDSVSGERLGVLVDKAPTVAGDDKLSWDSIGKAFSYYAERYKSRLQGAKQAN